jgi:hypothetical protein
MTMEIMYSIVGFFVAGGPFMYPILIVFAVGTAIAIERWSSRPSSTATSTMRGS